MFAQASTKAACCLDVRRLVGRALSLPLNYPASFLLLLLPAVLPASQPLPSPLCRHAAFSKDPMGTPLSAEAFLSSLPPSLSPLPTQLLIRDTNSARAQYKSIHPSLYLAKDTKLLFSHDVAAVCIPNKALNGERVQVDPPDSSTRVKYLDLSLVNSRNLSWVGEVRPVVSCGQVKNLYPSG